MEGLKHLAPMMTRAGHPTEVAALDSPDAPWLKTFPAPVHALGPGYGRYGYTKHFDAWMHENARSYDVVVVRGVWQYHSFGSWRALRGGSVPYAVFTHGMLDPWFKRRYPVKHLKKALYWKLVEHRVLRDAAAVLFTCEEERVLAGQCFRPYQCNQLVVNYGTSAPPGEAAAQREVFLREYPRLSGKRLALFMSRIHHKKGCDLLIRAFAQVCREFPECHLVIAGPDLDGWGSELRSVAQQLGIADRLTWSGMLSGDMKWGAFRAAEVFVLPSHSENFGIVVAEAMACGVPVLISDKVNIWREVQQAGAGVVAPDTLAGTEHLFRHWLSITAEQRSTMSESAQRCFAAKFEIGRAARTLADTLARLCAAPASELVHVAAR